MNLGHEFGQADFQPTDQGPGLSDNQGLDCRPLNISSDSIQIGCAGSFDRQGPHQFALELYELATDKTTTTTFNGQTIGAEPIARLSSGQLEEPIFSLVNLPHTLTNYELRIREELDTPGQPRLSTPIRFQTKLGSNIMDPSLDGSSKVGDESKPKVSVEPFSGMLSGQMHSSGVLSALINTRSTNAKLQTILDDGWRQNSANNNNNNNRNYNNSTTAGYIRVQESKLSPFFQSLGSFIQSPLSWFTSQSAGNGQAGSSSMKPHRPSINSNGNGNNNNNNNNNNSLNETSGRTQANSGFLSAATGKSGRARATSDWLDVGSIYIPFIGSIGFLAITSFSLVISFASLLVYLTRRWSNQAQARAKFRDRREIQARDTRTNANYISSHDDQPSSYELTDGHQEKQQQLQAPHISSSSNGDSSPSTRTSSQPNGYNPSSHSHSQTNNSRSQTTDLQGSNEEHSFQSPSFVSIALNQFSPHLPQETRYLSLLNPNISHTNTNRISVVNYQSGSLRPLAHSRSSNNFVLENQIEALAAQDLTRGQLMTLGRQRTSYNHYITTPTTSTSADKSIREQRQHERSQQYESQFNDNLITCIDRPLISNANLLLSIGNNNNELADDDEDDEEHELVRGGRAFNDKTIGDRIGSIQNNNNKLISIPQGILTSSHSCNENSESSRLGLNQAVDLNQTSSERGRRITTNDQMSNIVGENRDHLSSDLHCNSLNHQNQFRSYIRNFSDNEPLNGLAVNSINETALMLSEPHSLNQSRRLLWEREENDQEFSDPLRLNQVDKVGVASNHGLSRQQRQTLVQDPGASYRFEQASPLSQIQCMPKAIEDIKVQRIFSEEQASKGEGEEEEEERGSIRESSIFEERLVNGGVSLQARAAWSSSATTTTTQHSGNLVEQNQPLELDPSMIQFIQLIPNSMAHTCQGTHSTVAYPTTNALGIIDKTCEGFNGIPSVSQTSNVQLTRFGTSLTSSYSSTSAKDQIISSPLSLTNTTLSLNSEQPSPNGDTGTMNAYNQTKLQDNGHGNSKNQQQHIIESYKANQLTAKHSLRANHNNNVVGAQKQQGNSIGLAEYKQIEEHLEQSKF